MQVNRDVQATDVSVYNLIFKLLCSGSRIFTVIMAPCGATAATSLQRSAWMLVFICDSCLLTVMMNIDAEWCKNHICNHIWRWLKFEKNRFHVICSVHTVVK